MTTDESSPDREEVSVDDLRRHPWQTIIGGQRTKKNSSYGRALLAEAERLKERGEFSGERAFSFLAKIAALWPDYNLPGNPYEQPWMKSAPLSPSDLDVLEEVFGEIEDPEFKARVGDVLWEFRRRHDAATVAANAFVDSAHRLEEAKLWPPFVKRLERALALAGKLGRGKPLHTRLCDEVEQTITKYKEVNEAGFLCSRLIQLLDSHRRLDSARYSKLCKDLAARFSAAKQWDKAHDYWTLSAKHCRRLEDAPATSKALVEAAECWAAKAEENIASENPNALFAAHWMGKAFYELQQASAPEERQIEVHRRLRELQKNGLKRMSPLPISEELLEKFEEHESRIADFAREHVRGLDFDEALCRLAFMAEVPDPSEIKARIESESSHSVWTQIIPTATVTESGLTADQLGPMPTSSGPEYDDWMVKRAYLHARQLEWPSLATLIEAAREQIVEENCPSIGDLVSLVTSNSFIPPGHEGIYRRGLYAGLVGDWLVAVHLLVPQLEASIRQVFEQEGIRTSSVESEGIQEEKLLGKLLFHEKMENLFGVAPTFNLRGILVEKLGFNLRNDMAHGFISEAGFFSPAAPVLWWLTLRMCWLGSTAVEP